MVKKWLFLSYAGLFFHHFSEILFRIDFRKLSFSIFHWVFYNFHWVFLIFHWVFLIFHWVFEELLSFSRDLFLKPMIVTENVSFCQTLEASQKEFQTLHVTFYWFTYVTNFRCFNGTGNHNLKIAVNWVFLFFSEFFRKKYSEFFDFEHWVF